MKKILFFLFRIVVFLLLFIFVWSIFNFSKVLYGIDQLKGQLHIVMNARPLTVLMKDSTVTDSIKQKLIFIEEIKKFAIDSLGLKPSENYTTFYDQENKPLLWVLTASEPYSIKPYEWKFPVLGYVSYKGFFNYEDGKEEELNLSLKDYDTDYSEVSAWSTLGWFKDPILSSMLRRSDGQLAELIIHELTHSTIYLKSNVNLNENLASVCGEQGAILFLKSKGEKGIEKLKEYMERKEDYDQFSKHMLLGTQLLDSLYKVMEDSLVLLKKTSKKKMIDSIVASLDTVHFHNKIRYKDIFKFKKPNNAYFLDFVRYDAKKEEMKNELMEKFHGSIKDYIEYVNKKYN
jgi:predicted aminopeptidase